MRHRTWLGAFLLATVVAVPAAFPQSDAEPPVELTGDARALLDELALLLDAWYPAFAEYEYLDRWLDDDELADVESEADRLRKLYKRTRKAYRESLAKSDRPDARPPREPLEFRSAEDLLEALDEFLLAEYNRRLEEQNAALLPLVQDAAGRDAEHPLSPEEQEHLRVVGESVRRLVRKTRQARERQALAAKAYDTPIDQPLPTDPGEIEELPKTREGRELAQQTEDILVEYTSAATPEEPRDAPQPIPILKNWKFYGSVRLRVFKPSGQGAEASDQSSRIGASWRRDLNSEGSLVFSARGEFGLSFLDTFDRILEYGDGNQSKILDDDVLFLRLAFVALDSRFGRVSFGKQWSAYYDVALFTDQMPAQGGLGTGAYAAGTDGGVSGTGRADNALQYRLAVEPASVSLQMQIRSETENDRPLADTYGGSFRWRFSNGVDLGIGYNKVLDGVPDPESGQPKEGDQARILGVRYDKGRLYAALTQSSFLDHEIDDLGRYYSGTGWELYADYDVGRNVLLRVDLALLTPDSRHPGDFRFRTMTVGASWKFREKFLLYPLIQFDRSTASDGSPLQDDQLIVGLNYTF